MCDSTDGGLCQIFDYNNIQCIVKCHQTGELHLFMSYSGGFPQNLVFFKGSQMIAFVHETPSQKIMKIVAMCEN